MNTYIKAVFSQEEQRSEQLSAHLRVLIFFVLLFLASVLPDPGHHHHQSIYALVAGYGLSAAATELLAYKRFFRPWLPWVFVSLDVALLVAFLVLMSKTMGIPSVEMLGLPGTSLIFVFLAHAALRHRPWLVASTAGLFVLAWIVVVSIYGSANPGPIIDVGSKHQSSQSDHHDFLGEYLRLAVVGLTALILIVSVTRARNCLLVSIQQARRTANLSRYIPQAVAAELADAGLEAVLKSRRQFAVVIFADIRNFTAMAEHMEAQEVANLLTEFRSRLSQPILDHGGVVDKYIGDAIMAVFGTPQPRDTDGGNALATCRSMVRAVEDWNDLRVSSGKQKIDVGIGAHYGIVFSGAIGDANRLEFTVVGDTVNIADRLEKLTRQTDSMLIVSADLIRAAKVAEDQAVWKALPPQILPGRSEPIEVYKLDVS